MGPLSGRTVVVTGGSSGIGYAIARRCAEDGAATLIIARGAKALDESLRRAGDEVEGRLSRGLVQAQNARDALREQVLAAQGTAARLLKQAESADAFAADGEAISTRLPEPVGQPD